MEIEQDTNIQQQKLSLQPSTLDNTCTQQIKSTSSHQESTLLPITSHQKSNYVSTISPLLTFESIPDSVLIKIMEYLSPQQVFNVLQHVNHHFRHLLSPFSPQNKLFGFRYLLANNMLTKATQIRVPHHHKQEKAESFKAEKMLKILEDPKIYRNLLSFGGYATTGGVDNSSEFWVDTVFLKGMWNVCSKQSTKNINIAGGPLFQETNDERSIYSIYLKHYDQICNIIEAIALHIFYNMNYFNQTLSFIRRMFYEFKAMHVLFEIFDEGMENTEQQLQLLCLATNIYQKQYLNERINLPLNDLSISDPTCPINDNIISIISGFEINREGMFSCPVKTLMIFGSFERIQVNDNQQMDIYNDITTEDQLQYAIYHHGLEIQESNIQQFSKQQQLELPLHDNFDNQADLYKYIIFKNTFQYEFQSTHSAYNSSCQTVSQTSKIFPIAWVQFESPHLESIQIKLKEMQFVSCKYIALKLIDCENKIKEPSKKDYSNIDINYVQFTGIHMEQIQQQLLQPQH